MYSLLTGLQYPELAKATVWVSQYFGGYGPAIIIITLLIRIFLYPLMYFAERQKTVQQIKISLLKPHINKLIKAKKKLPKTKQEPYNQKIVHLYRENGIRLLHGFQILTWAIQLPLLACLYLAIRYTPQLNHSVYATLPLGKSNLLVFLVVLLIYISSTIYMLKSMPKYQRDPIKYISFAIPAIVGAITLFSPGGVQLYFLISGLFDFVLNVVMTKQFGEFKVQSTKSLKLK